MKRPMALNNKKRHPRSLANDRYFAHTYSEAIKKSDLSKWCMISPRFFVDNKFLEAFPTVDVIKAKFPDMCKDYDYYIDTLDSTIILSPKVVDTIIDGSLMVNDNEYVEYGCFSKDEIKLELTKKLAKITVSDLLSPSLTFKLGVTNEKTVLSGQCINMYLSAIKIPHEVTGYPIHHIEKVIAFYRSIFNEYRKELLSDMEYLLDESKNPVYSNCFFPVSEKLEESLRRNLIVSGAKAEDITKAMIYASYPLFPSFMAKTVKRTLGLSNLMIQDYAPVVFNSDKSIKYLKAPESEVMRRAMFLFCQPSSYLVHRFDVSPEIIAKQREVLAKCKEVVVASDNTSTSTNSTGSFNSHHSLITDDTSLAETKDMVDATLTKIVRQEAYAENPDDPNFKLKPRVKKKLYKQLKYRRMLSEIFYTQVTLGSEKYYEKFGKSRVAVIKEQVKRRIRLSDTNTSIREKIDKELEAERVDLKFLLPHEAIFGDRVYTKYYLNECIKERISPNTFYALRSSIGLRQREKSRTKRWASPKDIEVNSYQSEESETCEYNGKVYSKRYVDLCLQHNLTPNERLSKNLATKEESGNELEINKVVDINAMEEAGYSKFNDNWFKTNYLDNCKNCDLNPNPSKALSQDKFLYIKEPDEAEVANEEESERETKSVASLKRSSCSRILGRNTTIARNRYSRSLERVESELISYLEQCDENGTESDPIIIYKLTKQSDALRAKLDDLEIPDDLSNS